jgi:hypothetical protein
MFFSWLVTYLLIVQIFVCFRLALRPMALASKWGLTPELTGAGAEGVGVRVERFVRLVRMCHGDGAANNLI